MQITRKQIEAFSAPLGFNPDIVEAVTRKEAGSGGFDAKTGKIKIQFEPSHFKKHVPAEKKAAFLAINAKTEAGTQLSGEEKVIFENWVIALRNKVELQAAEWSAFNSAWKIDEEAALLSTSFGAFQILGENFAAAGFRSVRDMHSQYLTGEPAQLSSFLKFVNANGILRKILKAPELTKADAGLFARYYNGAAFIEKPVAERYDTLLFKHYLDIKAGK